LPIDLDLLLISHPYHPRRSLVMIMLAKNFFNMFMNKITNQVMNKLEAEETDDDYTAEEDPEE
jgi:hypothetical protein